jgi:hypothetical protein
MQKNIEKPIELFQLATERDVDYRGGRGSVVSCNLGWRGTMGRPLRVNKGVKKN